MSVATARKRAVHAFLAILPVIALAVLSATTLSAQGVTTAAIDGYVTDVNGAPLSGARVLAVHVPSGTQYIGMSRQDGRVTIPGMRVGGPYTVTASYVGYQPQRVTNVVLTLGVASDLRFELPELTVQLGEITVTGTRDAVFSSDRTGAATSVPAEAIERLPASSRRIEDFARLTPQYSGGPFGFSFAGQDNRLNNMTVDGSYFNNSFGLAGQPGDRTGVAPISLDAIEQVQINVAPYDVRQGNFVGAGVNTVTRSGTNRYRGTLYYQWRNEGLVGRDAGSNTFDPGTFNFSQLGATLGGPIIRDRLFFFASYETEQTEQPGTTFTARAAITDTVRGNVTRVLRSDLDALSTYLATNFDYATGPYAGYTHETPGTRYLVRLDYNANARNKLSLRYTHLDSRTDVLLSNSSSLGFGTRRSNLTGLNFQNSNYIILENIRSIVGEWNAVVADNMSNNFIVGYTYQDESRDSRGDFFPMVDILEGGSVYTTFGFEPFTPSNELRYGSFQVLNNFSIYGRNHSLTFGASLERYESENIFFPGSQSVYVYNSLADFYTDANGYLANRNRPTGSTDNSPVSLRTFQVRWSNIPGMDKPVQPLEVLYAGVYAQDEWRVSNRLKTTFGIRLDLPSFGNTGFVNYHVEQMVFLNSAQYRTDRLPDRNVLFSPRFGFNLDLMGDRRTQIRGGSGVFTGRPAYVWVSNQIGENGRLTGFAFLTNTTARPFHPNPNHYKPASVSGAPASSYALAITEPGFKFPQLWRTNLAIDQRLPWGFIGTAEYIYNRDVNGISYINANLRPANGAFVGADNRPRWIGTNRIQSNITSAIVLQNQNVGTSYNIAFSLERPFRGGFFAKAAYSYGESRNTVDPGSIAFGSWNNNQHAGDPNNPGTGYSSNSPGHRLFTAFSYRRSFFGLGQTTVSLYWESRTIGNASYVFSGDLNNDGGTSNDLIYIPRNASEMNFREVRDTIRVGIVITAIDTFTIAQQVAAWEAFILQDKYLSANRGRYAERGAVWMPMVRRADLSITQEVSRGAGGLNNRLQFRLDIFNFGNWLNQDWGIGQRFVTTSPLIVPSTANGGPVDATTGGPRYELRRVNRQLITKTFEPTAGGSDVWRVQLGVRYTFN